MTKRRKYSAEFKREAITLTCQPGVSCRQIALEIGKSGDSLPINDERPKLAREEAGQTELERMVKPQAGTLATGRTESGDLFTG